MKVIKNFLGFLKRCFSLVTLTNIFIVLIIIILFQKPSLVSVNKIFSFAGLLGISLIVIGLWYTHYFIDTINIFYYILTNKKELIDNDDFEYEPALGFFIIVGLIFIFF